QVRNVRIQDDSGDIRVALWGEKADRDIAAGDELQFADVEIQDGWRDDLEASAGWRTSVFAIDGGAATSADEDDDSAEGLDAFGGGDTESEASDESGNDRAASDEE